MTNARDKANIPTLNFSSTGIDDNATSTAITIDSSENVGLGTTSPSRLLHLNTTGSGNNTYLQLTSDATGTGTLDGFQIIVAGNDSSTILAQRENSSLQFRTNNTERMRISSGGNVGIGTTSATTKLDVIGAGVNGIELGQQSDNSANSSRLFFNNSTNIWTTYSTQGNFKIASGATIGSSSGTDRLVIDSSGRVMVGTTTAGGILSLDNTGQTSETLLQLEDAGGSGAHSHITLKNTTGTVASILTTSDNLEFRVDDETIFANISGTELARITSGGAFGVGISSPSAKVHSNTSSNGATTPIILSNYDTTAGTNQKNRLDFGLARNSGALKTNAGRIEVGREQDWTNADSNIDSYMAFSTYLNNASTEHMRIDSSGNVGINNTAPNLNPWNKAVTLSGTNNCAYELAKGSTLHGAFGLQGDNRVQLINFQSADITFNTTSSASERMRITSAGNVGIGTTSPTGKLNIATASTDGVNTLFGANTSPTAAGMYVGFNNSDATATLGVYYASTSYPVMNITRSNRKVGINTTTPSEQLEVNGTVKATAFQGDGSALTGVGGANTPAFSVKKSSNQTISDTTSTKMELDSEVFDTDNKYDNSTNYRFTPGVAGKYFLFASTAFQNFTQNRIISVTITKNGSSIASFNNISGSYSDDLSAFVSVIAEANTTDYFEAFCFHRGGSSQTMIGSASTFGGFKLIE